MEASATATAADAERIGVFVNDPSSAGHYTTTDDVEVPTLPALVNQIYDDVREQATGYAGFLSPPWGVFDGIVTGNTNGTNRDFDVIGMGFYPSYAIFSDGKKVPNSQIVRTGNRVKLPVAPISGAVVEATGGADPDRIAPDGYKSLTFVSNKNDTINITVSEITTPLPKWKIGGVATEGLAFSYVNDGSIVSVHLYLHESNMSNAVVDAESEGILLFDAQPGSVIKRLILGNNPIVSARGLANIDTSGCYTFSGMLIRNPALASIPLFDTSGCSGFFSLLLGNSALTSIPLFDTSNGTDLRYLAYVCSSLTSVPSGLFSRAKSVAYGEAFSGCALTQVSVDNILISVAASIVATPTLINGTLDLGGGTSAAPSSDGLAAKAALVAAGWTVTHN